MALHSLQQLTSLLRESHPDALVLNKCLGTFKHQLATGIPKKTAETGNLLPTSTPQTEPAEKGVQKICSHLSKILNIGSDECKIILSNYVLFAYTGTERNINILASNSASMNTFVLELLDFYEHELCLIFQSLALLTHLVSQGESLFQKVAENFLSIHFDEESLVKFLCDQLKNVDVTTFVSDVLSQNCRIRLKYSISLALLSCMYNLQQTIEDKLLVVETVLECNFGKIKMLRGLGQENNIEDIEYETATSYVLMLSTILVNDLEDCFRKSMEKDSNLEEERKNWELLETKLDSMNDSEFCGPVYLARALMAQCFDGDSAKLGQMAQLNNAAQVIQDLFLHPIFKSNPDLHKTAANVMYPLIDIFVTNFMPESLAPTEVYAEILCHCLKYEEIAEMFWESNFSTGIAHFVKDLLYKFPAIYRETIEILTALCKASQNSCQKVVNLMKLLPCYTENVDKIRVDDLVEDGDDKFILANDRIPYASGDKQFVIATHTVGLIIESDGVRGGYVQWQHEYSGWQLCLTKMRHDLAQGLSPKECATVLNLVAACIQQNPQMTQEMVHFLDLALLILRNVNEGPLIDTSVVTHCIKCLKEAAKINGKQILEALTNCNVLPSSDMFVHGSLLQKLIANDINNCDFEATLQIVELLMNFVKSVQGNQDVLNESISYVLERVFSQYHTFGFQTPEHKDQIGSSCVQLIHTCIQKKESKVADMVYNGKCGLILLELACTGCHTVNAIAADTAHRDSVQVNLRTVSVSLSVLCQLLDKMSADKTQLLEKLMKELPISRRIPTVVLTRYIMCRVDSRISKLAMLTLAKVANIFPGALLSCMGNDCMAFCDAFLYRLESPLEDSNLRMYCVNFLSNCIGKQPALAEQLLECDQDDKTENTCLKTVYQILKADNEPPQLVLAVVKLLVVIWQHRHKQAVTNLASMPGFWTVLASPLQAGEDSFYLALVAQVMLVISEELLWRKSTNQTLSTELSTLFDCQNGILQKSRVELLYVKIGELIRSQIDVAQKVEICKCVRAFVNVICSMTAIQPDAQTCQLWINDHCRLLPNVAEHESELVILYVGETCSRLLCSWNEHVLDWSVIIDEMIQFSHVITDRSPLPISPHALAHIIVPAFSTVLLYDAKDIQDRRMQLLDPICRLIKEELRAINEQPENNKALESCASTVCCLKSMVMKSKEHCYSILTKYAVLRNLVSTLELLQKKGNQHVMFYSSVLSLATRICDSKEGYSLILSSKLCEFICLEGIQLLNGKALSSEQNSLIQNLFLFFMHGVMSIRVPFISKCLDFLGSHFDIISQILLQRSDLDTCIVCTQFLLELSNFKQEWLKQFFESVDQTLKCVKICSSHLISSLSRSKTPKGILKKSPTKRGAASPTKVSGCEVHLLFNCVQILRAFSVPLSTISEDLAGIDASSSSLLLEFEFSSAGAGEDGLSFGCLVSTIQMSSAALRRAEPRVSSSPSAHRVTGFSMISDKSVMSALMECSIELVLSQSCIALMSPNIHENDKQLLRRELAAELEPLLSRCLRYAGGSPSPSTPRRSPSIHPPSTLFDLQYLKLTHDLLKDTITGV